MPALTDSEYARLLALQDGLRRSAKRADAAAADAGLTPAQHALLVAVRGHGDPTVGDLAEHLQLRHHSAVELVDRAAAADLVRRATDRDDARVVRVRLTRRGTSALGALAAIHREILKSR